MEKIIGRKKEIKLLDQVLSSKQAELVAVYGRRRVGKTFLIHQYLFEKGIYVECTGIKDGKLQDQLTNFMLGFQTTFYPNLSLNIPKSWRKAFELLTEKIREISPSNTIILFFDEMPWLASRKSKFLQEFDFFWNTQWSRLPNVKIIVCGSAASWILDNLINAKGGLYNRITKTILLEPFSLGDTKLFLESRDIHLTPEQILDIYMVMGGIPFYLNQIQKNRSVTQNIDEICFTNTGLLYSEFPRLFKSLFKAYEINLRIVRIIAKYRYGISFSELAKKIKKKAGGRLTDRLNELEAAGFIAKLLPYGKKQRDHYYRVNDEYTMFYLHWIEEVTGKIPKGSHYWHKISQSASWQSWAGFSFEIVCHKHVNKIIEALELSQIGCLVGTWKYIPKAGEKEQGSQIDLLLDRSDEAISVCEIKYSSQPFSVDKSYATNLMQKLDVFQKKTNTKKQLFLVLITAQGVKKNIWSEELVNQVVELNELFS